MSISESGPCSQVNHGLWKEKRRSLVFVDKGSLLGVISLGGILSGLCREGVLVRGWSLGHV